MNTADLLLANLERLLSSPTSAETIRKLIFDLAIRGQLTTQSDKDEPASVLIAKVIRTAQAEDRKFSAEPAVTERPFELPSGWEWVRLGNTGKIFNGTSASAGEKARLSKTPDGLPFIATKDVGYGRDPLCYENGLKVPHGDKDYKVAKSGAVLICAEGGSAGKKVGQTNRPICFGNKLYANETWAGIEAGYILSLYQSNFFYGEFKAKMTGIIGGIARSEFRSLRIPLPPLAEQKRIVAKVDELMALCDRLEAQLKERDVKQATLAKAALAKFTEDPTPENLQLLFHPSFSIEPEELRGAIITIATQGGLTTRDRNDKPVQTTSTTKPPFEIPSNWRWKTLKEIGLCRTGKTPPTNDSANYGPGFPFIGPGQITPNGKIIEPEKYITREGLEYSTDASEGDILMVCIGGSIGKTAICLNPIGFNQQINSVRPYQDLAQYVYLAIKANYFKKQVLDGATGSATPIINKSRWEQIPIPIPPLAEQKRIVEKVESYMMLIEQLKSQLEASRNTGEKLLEAMVAELTSA